MQSYFFASEGISIVYKPNFMLLEKFKQTWCPYTAGYEADASQSQRHHLRFLQLPWFAFQKPFALIFFLKKLFHQKKREATDYLDYPDRGIRR